MVMRNQYTLTDMKHTVYKVAEYVIYVFAVFKTVCKKAESVLTRSHDQ